MFIHILRDGREVAVSAKKKYYGDIRKITQNKESDLMLKDREKHLIAQIIHKFKLVLNPLYFIKNLGRFWNMTLKELNLKKYSQWGVRYPGYSYLFKHYKPIEIAADQWQYSVLQIKNYFYNKKNCFYEIKYEDLMTNPENEISKILNFLSISNVEKIIHDINPEIYKKHFPNLSEKDKIFINQKIGHTLSSLGYQIE
jgi:hypothetical protein